MIQCTEIHHDELTQLLCRDCGLYIMRIINNCLVLNLGREVGSAVISVCFEFEKELLGKHQLG